VGAGPSRRCGAIHLLENKYTFPRVAGTSVGSIVGALLAAGINTAADLRKVMGELDYSRVPDRAPPRIPIAGAGFSLLARGGAHPGDYVHTWLHEQLEKLGKQTFGDLRLKDAGADPNFRTSSS
jgi:NTE family protein